MSVSDHQATHLYEQIACNSAIAGGIMTNKASFASGVVLA